MYQTVLRDSSFFALLLQLDQDLAAEARAAGCACGGALHRAHYPRKPRGGPDGLGAEHSVRLSFCCSVEGCRKRVTPRSLRFLGRKVFFGVWVLLLPVLRDGPTRERLRRLEEVFRRQPTNAAALAAVLARGSAGQPVLGRRDEVTSPSPVAVQRLCRARFSKPSRRGGSRAGGSWRCCAGISPLSCGCREQAF